MTAEKNQNTKEKKKALPKPKDLKWRGMERGSYCLGGPWNLLQSMNRIVLRKEHRWLAGRALCCVSYFCVHSWVQVCLDFDLFFMFSKKAVSAAMLRLFLCLCLPLSLCL